MKILKYNFKSLIMCLSAIGFITIFLISCQDDDKLSNQMHQKTMFQGYSDSQIEDEIINFKATLEKIRLDPKETLAEDEIDIESTLWLLEATVNYTYGNAIQPEIVQLDTSYVTLSVNSTVCKMGDIQIIYDNIVDSIAAYFYELKDEEKYFLMTNISIESQNSQNVTLQVISYFSLNGIIPNVNDYDWYWGFNLGQCGTNIGAPLDAADIIMKGANSSILIPAPEFYYTDAQMGFSGLTFLVTNSQNQQLGFEGYYTSGTGPCLTQSEILFFKQGLIYIAEQGIPEGKEICNYYSHDEKSLGTSSPHLICHYAKITYGIRHYRNGSAETLPNNQNNI